ncbi:hypothetical protein F4802DRAFT_618620 [Xylaria palmicola]|nr:hypothetical protein F4802DRAFT_618620 [Xylaria palmicola]
MAADQADAPSQRLSQFEDFDHQINPQASGIIESNFLDALGYSQGTQGVSPIPSDNGGTNEKVVGSQSIQPITSHFIRRPEREDPLDFQDGFQYSKAPTLQILPLQPNANPRDVGFQADPACVTAVSTRYSPRKSGCRDIDGPSHDTSHALRQKLGKCWNDFFGYEATRNTHWEDKMRTMVQQLAERDDSIAKYVAKAQSQEQKIKNLETINEEQHSTCQNQENVLADVEKQRQGLQAKIKEYRDRLNDATKEQQDIFKYFQPRYSEMREQLKQAEDDRRNSLEQALSATENIRDKIQKNMVEVKALSHEGLQKLRLEVAILQAKLEERNKEVIREQSHIDDLRRELGESHKINQTALESLNKQNQELIEKDNERIVHCQNMELCINRQEQGIQSLLEFLRSIKETTVGPLELAENLKMLQTEVLDSVLSEFREYTASVGEISSKTAVNLKSDIDAVHTACTDLGKQIQNNQHVLEWQARYERLQLDHQTLLYEADRLKTELAKTQHEANKQVELHNGVQEEMATLRANAKVADELDTRIDNLETAKQVIQMSLDDKEEHNRNLEGRLREAEKALQHRDTRIKDQEHDIYTERERYAHGIAACRKQQEQATEQARAEESAKARANIQDLQVRLRDAEQDCSRLQEELAQAKHNEESALKTTGEVVARQMEDMIDPAINRMNAALDGMQALGQTSLEAWSSDHVELSLLKQAVQKLAENQQRTIQTNKLLGELLDTEKKLADTWQSHKSEVDALNRAKELEKVQGAEEQGDGHQGENSKQQSDVPPVPNRRVMIRSPGINDASHEKMTPLSIEEERVARRQAASPTGIMKPALQVEGRLGEACYSANLVTTKQTRGAPGQRVVSRDATPTLVSRSTYNRPVLGSSSMAERSLGNPVFEIFENGSPTLTKPSLALKRKRPGTDNGESEGAGENKAQTTKTSRAKISSSMSTYFQGPSPNKLAIRPIPVQARPEMPKGGPIERKPRSFITYSSSSLSTQ